jgi:hypothetical protein
MDQEEMAAVAVADPPRRDWENGSGGDGCGCCCRPAKEGLGTDQGEMAVVAAADEIRLVQQKVNSLEKVLDSEIVTYRMRLYKVVIFIRWRWTTGSGWQARTTLSRKRVSGAIH